MGATWAAERRGEARAGASSLPGERADGAGRPGQARPGQGGDARPPCRPLRRRPSLASCSPPRLPHGPPAGAPLRRRRPPRRRLPRRPQSHLQVSQGEGPLTRAPPRRVSAPPPRHSASGVGAGSLQATDSLSPPKAAGPLPSSLGVCLPHPGLCPPQASAPNMQAWSWQPYLTPPLPHCPVGNLLATQFRSSAWVCLGGPACCVGLFTRALAGKWLEIGGWVWPHQSSVGSRGSP